MRRPFEVKLQVQQEMKKVEWNSGIQLVMFEFLNFAVIEVFFVLEYFNELTIQHDEIFLTE